MINNNKINNNNFNNRLGQILTGLTGSLPRRALNFAQLGRAVYQMFTNTRRVRTNARRTNGIEINKSEGGNKSVRFNGRTVFQTIEFYGFIRVNPGNNYRYEMVFDNVSSQDFNLASALNQQDEFLTLRKQALQYNIQQIACSFNYNRIPKAGEKWSKMIITPETDLIEIAEPKINANSMIWDMSKNGTKNYNFRINRLNTEPENAGWIIGQSSFNGIISLHISEQGENYSPDYIQEEIATQLGEFKISVRIAYRHKDISELNAKTKRVDKQKVLNEIIKEKAEQLSDIIYEDVE